MDLKLKAHGDETTYGLQLEWSERSSLFPNRHEIFLTILLPNYATDQKTSFSKIFLEKLEEGLLIRSEPPLQILVFLCKYL